MKILTHEMRPMFHLELIRLPRLTKEVKKIGSFLFFLQQICFFFFVCFQSFFFLCFCLVGRSVWLIRVWFKSYIAQFFLCTLCGLLLAEYHESYQQSGRQHRRGYTVKWCHQLERAEQGGMEAIFICSIWALVARKAEKRRRMWQNKIIFQCCNKNETNMQKL